MTHLHYFGDPQCLKEPCYNNYNWYWYCFSVLSYRSDLALDCLRPECTSRLKVNNTIRISIKCVYWNGAEIRWASQPTWVYPPKQNTILLLITERYSNERHLWFGFYFSSQLRSSYYIRSILSIYCIYPPRHNNYCIIHGQGEFECNSQRRSTQMACDRVVIELSGVSNNSNSSYSI